MEIVFIGLLRILIIIKLSPYSPCIAQGIISKRFTMKLITNGDMKRYEAVSTYKEKDIPKGAGFRWDPAIKRWWTSDIETAIKLIEYADDETFEALNAIRDRKHKMRKMSKSSDSDIEIPAPNGLTYMPFQKAGINYILNQNNVLLADEMGLGKSISALGVINIDPTIEKVLVICPASLKLNWQYEARKWLLDNNLNPEVIDAKNPLMKTMNFVIINYDILNKYKAILQDCIWDIMIVDECHFLKNPKVQRTKAVLGSPESKKTFYDKTTITPAEEGIKANRKMFLTGTPIVNRPIDIFPVLNNIAPNEFGNFFKFVTRYCGAYRSRYGWDFSGASNLEELQNKLRETCMVRRLKVDVLKELPAKSRSVIEIPATGKVSFVKKEQKSQATNEETLEALRAAVELAKVSDDRSVYAESVNQLKETSQVAFTEIAQLRKETAIAKAPAVAEYIKENIESSGKIVVFAHHHEVIDTFVAELSEIGCVKLDGRNTMQSRNKAVQAFQNDPNIKIFIGGIQAAGVGLTLTASSHVIFAELDWVPGNMSQAEDRCHRIGQSDHILVQHLVLAGSIDAQLAHALVDKQKVIDKALDTEVTPDQPIIRLYQDADESNNENRKEKPYVSPKQREIEDEALKMSRADIVKVHNNLKILDALCDGANQLDSAGFNKVDTHIGKALAAMTALTPKQAALGSKITRKYHRQLIGDYKVDELKG